MSLLFLLGFIWLEIYSLVYVGGHIGLWRVLGLLFLSGCMGLVLVTTQGRAVMVRLQEAGARGVPPASVVVQGLLVFLSGLLFLIPGFLSDAVALFMILPGFRTLFAKLVGVYFAGKIAKGQVHVFGQGGFRFGAAPGFGGQPRTESSEGHAEFSGRRDVTPKVIDVRPLSVEESRDSRP